MVFTNWKEKFLLYGDLCSNLPIAQRAIEMVTAKSKQVAEVLEVISQLIAPLSIVLMCIDLLSIDFDY